MLCINLFQHSLEGLYRQLCLAVYATPFGIYLEYPACVAESGQTCVHGHNRHRHKWVVDNRCRFVC